MSKYLYRILRNVNLRTLHVLLYMYGAQWHWHPLMQTSYVYCIRKCNDTIRWSKVNILKTRTPINENSKDMLLSGSAYITGSDHRSEDNATQPEEEKEGRKTGTRKRGWKKYRLVHREGPTMHESTSQFQYRDFIAAYDVSSIGRSSYWSEYSHP